MITYQRLRQQAAVFQCGTGLTVKVFEDLLPAFERAYQRMLATDSSDGSVKIWAVGES